MSAEYIKAYRCDGNYQQKNNSAPDVSTDCQPFTSPVLRCPLSVKQHNATTCGAIARIQCA